MKQQQQQQESQAHATATGTRLLLLSTAGGGRTHMASACGSLPMRSWCGGWLGAATQLCGHTRQADCAPDCIHALARQFQPPVAASLSQLTRHPGHRLLLEALYGDPPRSHHGGRLQQQAGGRDFIEQRRAARMLTTREHPDPHSPWPPLSSWLLVCHHCSRGNASLSPAWLAGHDPQYSQAGKRCHFR